MRRTTLRLAIATGLSLMLLSTVIAGDESTRLNSDLAIYFEVDSTVVAKLAELGADQDEYAVALFVSQIAKMDLSAVVKLRLGGAYWPNILTDAGVTHDRVHVIVVGDIKSKTYSPIFEKFKAVPQSDRASVILGHQEIIDLINLKFISSHHDYSVFQVMAMRDFNRTFAKINLDVANEKEKMAKKEMAKRVADAKAKKDKQPEAKPEAKPVAKPDPVEPEVADSTEN